MLLRISIGNLISMKTNFINGINNCPSFIDNTLRVYYLNGDWHGRRLVDNRILNYIFKNKIVGRMSSIINKKLYYYIR